MKPFQVKLSMFLFALFAFSLVPTYAHASVIGTGLPWEHVLVVLSQSLSGPVALSISLISLAVGCMILIMGDPGKGARMVVCVLIGFSIVAGGVGFLNLIGLSTAVM